MWRHHAGGRVWRWAMPPPAVAAETLPAGGDRQHGLRPSPAGRSALPTARTPSHRCRRPPHRPNHHRASPAAGCAAIPYVAPQCSPHGIRDRATGRGPGRWAVGSGYGQAESPSSAAPRPGLLHVMTTVRITAGINNAEDAGRMDPQIGFADALRRVFPTTVVTYLECRG